MSATSLLHDAAPVRADFIDDVPVPRHLAAAFDLLVELEYTPRAIDGAIAHLGLYGSAECCFWIDPPHRAMVEALLPRDPRWDSGAWDVVAWAPGA